MKISKELLQKYVSGNCTEDERKEIDIWLNSGGKFPKTHYEELFEPRKEIIRQKLHKRLWHNYNTLGRNTKRIIRFSAAACMLFGAFLGGRVSANTNAPAIVESHKNEKQHLYITGGKGSNGNLPGDNFQVKFDGTLRLYNGSLKPQTVQSGSSSFILEPKQAYFLTGSTENAQLINDLSIGIGDMNTSGDNETLGDFSISILD